MADKFRVIASQTCFYECIVEAPDEKTALAYAHENPNLEWKDFAFRGDWQLEQADLLVT